MADIHVTPSQRVGSIALIEHNYYGDNNELTIEEGEKGVPLEEQPYDTFQGLTEPERPKPVLPAGVRQMEAITMVWTNVWLVAAYTLYAKLFIGFAFLLSGRRMAKDKREGSWHGTVHSKQIESTNLVQQHHPHILHQLAPAAGQLHMDSFRQQHVFPTQLDCPHRLGSQRYRWRLQAASGDLYQRLRPASRICDLSPLCGSRYV